MNVLICGASGLLGKALQETLDARGDTAIPLLRGPFDLEEIPHWQPDAGILHLPADLGIHAVINLSGASLAHLPWSRSYRETIRLSRVQSTMLLAAMLAEREIKPAVLLNASAVGFYGDRGVEWLDERSLPGSGFLADVCQQWEEGTRLAEEAGIRVIHLRLGPVLSIGSGMLARFLPLFRLGLGGRLGSGEQYTSWIHIEDGVAAILNLIDQEILEGPVNLTSPNPVTNHELTRTLGQVLHRPTRFPVPAWMLRLLMGQAAREMILTGQRARPAKLLDHDFSFQYPDLVEALNDLLTSDRWVS